MYVIVFKRLGFFMMTFFMHIELRLRGIKRSMCCEEEWECKDCADAKNCLVLCV